MNDRKTIPIQKEYDQEEVCQAVLTYMHPTNDMDRIKTEAGNNTYIIKRESFFKYQKEPKEEGEEKEEVSGWIEVCTVKLTFSEEFCYVDIDFGKGMVKGAQDVQAVGTGATIAAAVGTGMAGVGVASFGLPSLVAAGTIPLLGPVVLGGTAVTVGAGVLTYTISSAKYKSGFQQYKKGIYELIEGYLCVKKEKHKKHQRNGCIEKKCKCGAVLQKGAKFCAVCGKKVEEQGRAKTDKRKCECGEVLSEGAKFCPICGKKVEEQLKIQPEEITCECGAVLPAGTKFCPMCGKGVAG